MLRCDIPAQSIDSALLSLNDLLHRGGRRVEILHGRSEEIIVRNQDLGIHDFLLTIADNLDKFRMSFDATGHCSGGSVPGERALGDELRVGDWRFEDFLGRLGDGDSVEGRR
jgi:hypothetical protein